MSSSAYTGIKAVFKDVNLIDPDILFDVVIWQEDGGVQVGLIVVPESTKLIHPVHAPVPFNYIFTGYAYCP